MYKATTVIIKLIATNIIVGIGLFIIIFLNLSYNHDGGKMLLVARVFGRFTGGEGSPAAKAGILSGDIIYSFNGQPIETSDSLFKLLTEDKIGPFQYIGILWNSYKTEFRITPMQKNLI